MENTIVNEAVTAAKSIGAEVSQELLNGFKNEDFVPVDATYPETMKEGEAPLPKEKILELHEEYVDRIAKMSLTHSLFLGLGFEVPTGHALSQSAVERYLEDTKGQIQFHKPQIEDAENNDPEYWEFIVVHPACEYKFLDTDFWLGGIRALHFLVTRHDPDMVEYVNRKTAQVAGINDEWAKSLRV